MLKVFQLTVNTSMTQTKAWTTLITMGPVAKKLLWPGPK